MSEVPRTSRKQLLSERDAARNDSAKRSDYVSSLTRLNIRPLATNQAMLLTASDLELERLAREPRSRTRRCVRLSACDMGENRAFCAAATAMWNPSGRLEAMAIAPGIPEHRRSGAYAIRVPKWQRTARLVESGRLLVADGYRVPPATMMADLIRTEWGRPVKNDARPVPNVPTGRLQSAG